MNQNKKINRSLLAMTVLQIVPLSVFSQKSGERPNILFILCDDMGYGDLACYGQPYIHTPHIDQMAKEGMRFTQAYAGSPVSAPSRATLMTGQHTGHTHVRGNKEYWSRKNTVTYGQNKDFAVVGQEPYDPAHKILPEMLKDRGYRTGVFGKWAGGYEGSPSTPDKRGIDEFYGYICQFQAHLYYPNFLNRYSKSLGDTAVVREVMRQNIQYPMFGKDYFKRQQYSARIIHDKALEWIDQQDGKHPFVGFLTYTLPHAELAQPDDSIVENYKRKFFTDKTWGGWEDSWYNAVEHTHAQFAGMITRLDSYVGEIFNKLKEKGLDKNTIVIFTSDNGPHEEGGADPEFFGRDGKLKGLKRQCYEGGIRIPFIAWWPDHIKAGSVNDTQFAFYDLMPTFCDLAGIKNFAKRYTNKKLADDGFDGISIAPTLLGKDEKQKHHDYLYWEFHETDQIGVRKGDWKLVVVKGKPHLYNLAKDIHEDHDVSAEHPEIVKELVAAIYKEHKDNPSFQVTLPSIQKEFAQHTSDRSQLSPTPPMGWMTWNMFKGDISDQLIRETADAMVEKGFLEAGYQYIFIDDLWQGGRDNHNNIIPDPKKFPNGMKAVADYVHSKGLKLGIYSDAAQLTCGGWTASYGFEEQDARTFASWGIDYLKYDYCNAPEDSATARSRYRRMADALSKSGRDIILGICEWGQRKGEEWCEKVGGQLWRTSYDVRDMWKDTTHQGGMGILDIINISAPLAKHARHGQWMDMDMLVVGLQGKGGPSSDLGGTGCTYTEYQTQMSMWCMLSSVLALSNDLRKLTPEDSRILLNKEIIAINQDSLAQAAICKVSTATHQIYVRPLSDGSHAIAVLNFSDKPLTITADFKALGLKGKYTVRDIWEHRDISKNATRWEGKVNVHETKVFILK